MTTSKLALFVHRVIKLDVRSNQIIKFVSLRSLTKQFSSAHHVAECYLEESVARTPEVHLRKFVRLQVLLEIKKAQNKTSTPEFQPLPSSLDQ